MIGEKILNYHVDSLIGEGGVGTVYQATHAQLGRKVAIKALNPLLVNNEQVKQRFRQEATTLSNLQHINIITLYDYLENDKGLFLIMEYAQGEALDAFVRKRPIPEEQVRYYFSRILDGMEYAHHKGVIHRDIKPSNIIITQDANAKILDFGIAKILKEGKNNLTQPGAQLGTVLYMSPEQVQGKEIDHRTDIYSLGVTLFEMLVGKSPYNADQLTEFDVFNKIVNESLPAVKEFNVEISDRMQALINKATAKDPSQRFQSCAAFKEALLKQENATAQQAVNETVGKERGRRPTQVKAADTTPRAVETTTPKVVEKKQPTQKPKKKRRKKASAMPLYLLITVLVVLTGFLIYSELFEDSDTGDKKQSQTNTTKDSSQKEETKVATNENKNSEEDKKQKEEEKKRNAKEALLDSLNARIKRLQDTMRVVKKQRTSDLMKGLIVDGTLLEEDELAEGITVEVEMVNNREDVRFQGIIIAVKYFNEAGVEIEEYEHNYGKLTKDPKVPVAFKITRNIEAARFQCLLKSAAPIDLKPPTAIDSLDKVITRIREKIKGIEEK